MEMDLVIDSGFAKTMAIKSSGTLPVRGTGGQAAMQLASNFQIELGNLKLQRMTAGVIDLAEVATAIGKPLPLILGREAFNQLVIDIDFQRHRIAFHDPDHFSSPEGAVRVPLGRHGNDRTVAVSVEDRPAVPFDFDLGQGEPLDVYSSYRDSEHLLGARPESLNLSGGVGGIVKVKVATLKSIAVAGIPMTAVPTEFPDAADNASNSDQTAGNLGLPIFQPLSFDHRLSAKRAVAHPGYKRACSALRQGSIGSNKSAVRRSGESAFGCAGKPCRKGRLEGRRRSDRHRRPQDRREVQWLRAVALV
jgi:hypothetical protein